MTLANGQTGPEQETVPAFSIAHQKLADVTLTWRDALVWEQLPRELDTAEKVHLVIWLFAAGMLIALSEPHLPSWMLGGSGIPITLIAAVLAYSGFVIWGNVAQRRRAKLRLPYPQPTQTIVFSDHLQQKFDNGSVVTVTISGTRQTVQTPSHLFIEQADALAILPRACFVDGISSMVAFAAIWEAASRRASELQDMELPVSP